MPGVTLWNFAQGRAEEVDEAAIEQAVLSGGFGFPRGAAVPVVAPDGKAGTVDASEIALAIRGGYRYETEEQQAARARQERFGERPVAAGAAGFARGATLGLSDVALTKTGLVEPETLKALQEENLPASIGAEVAGTALPFLIPEPTTTAGAAARAAISLPKLAAKAGRAAGAGVEGALRRKAGKEVASTLLERGAGRIAAGGAEGAIFGAGQAVSEAALGDTTLAAEKLAANVTMGALLGGATAAVFQGTGAAARKLAEKGSKVIEKRVVPPAERKRLAALLPGPDGAPPPTLAGTESEAKRRADEAVEEATVELSGLLRSAINKFATSRATKASGAMLKDFREIQQRKGGIESFGRDLLDEGVVTPTATYQTIMDGAVARREFYGEKIGKLFDEMDTAIASTPGAAPKFLINGPAVFGRAKREVAEPLLNSRTASGQRVGRRVLKEIETMEESFAAGGPLIGFRDFHRARVSLDKEVFRNVTSKSPLIEEMRGFRRVLEKELEGAADKVAAELGQEGFRQNYRAVKRLFGNMKKAAEMAEDRLLRDEANRFFSPSDYGIGAALGFGTAAATGQPGYDPGVLAVGLLTGSLHKVMRTRGSAIMAGLANKLANTQIHIPISTLAGIQSASDEVGTGIRKSVDSFVDLATKPVPRTAAVRPVITAGLLDVSLLPERVLERDRERKRPTKQEAFRRLSKEVAELQANPSRLVEGLAKINEPLSSAAPATTAALAGTATRAVAFLAAKLPQNPRWGIGADRWEPSPVELTKFERYLSATLDPQSFLLNLSQGSINREAVEAMEVVYPRLLDDIKLQVVNKLSEAGDNVAYQDRIRLSLLFGVPLDQTLSPSFIAAMQQGYAATANAEEQNQQQARRESKVDIAGNVETKSQRVQAL
jgi:hypothetical protein